MLLCYRQLTHSTVNKNNGKNTYRNKFFKHLNIWWKIKMTMQNYSKLLALLKDYANKAGYDKNLQINFSKDWLDVLQRMTYTQINALKKQLSVKDANIENHGEIRSIEKCKDCENKSKQISIKEDTASNRPVKCHKTYQVNKRYGERKI